MINELGEVILTRELVRHGKPVLVQIGRPVPIKPGETDNYVPFRVVGLGDDEVKMAGGMDGVQAVLFALAMIGDLLKAEPGVTFAGLEPGFPVTTPEAGMYVSTLRLPMDMSLLKAVPDFGALLMGAPCRSQPAASSTWWSSSWATPPGCTAPDIGRVQAALNADEAT
jgi:hypothetical protein